LNAVVVPIEAEDDFYAGLLHVGDVQAVHKVQACGGVKLQCSDIDLLLRQFKPFESKDGKQVSVYLLSVEIVKRLRRKNLDNLHDNRLRCGSLKGALLHLLEDFVGSFGVLRVIPRDGPDENVGIQEVKLHEGYNPSLAASWACSSLAISRISDQLRGVLRGGTDW
jgi:hypothetical protein